MLDPERIREDEQAAESLRALAALAREFWDALRAAGIPDAAAIQMLIDWHHALITDGVVWEADDG